MHHTTCSVLSSFTLTVFWHSFAIRRVRQFSDSEEPGCVPRPSDHAIHNVPVVSSSCEMRCLKSTQHHYTRSRQLSQCVELLKYGHIVAFFCIDNLRRDLPEKYSAPGAFLLKEDGSKGHASSADNPTV